MPKATDPHQKRTAKPPTGGRRVHDWTTLRTRFVTGTESISDFAEREGVDRTSVAKRASAEGWTAEREKHREKVSAEATKKIAKHQARSESEIDGEAHSIAVLILQKAKGMVNDVDDPSALKAVAQSAEAAYRLARVTAHLPAEPVPAPGDASADGVIRIRRRSSTGDVVEVDIGGPTVHRTGPDGPDTNADTGAVPERREDAG